MPAIATANPGPWPRTQQKAESAPLHFPSMFEIASIALITLGLFYGGMEAWWNVTNGVCH